MVDFNTRSEMAVEKGSGTNRCCSYLNLMSLKWLTDKIMWASQQLVSLP